MKKNKYIKPVGVNEKVLSGAVIKYADIINGGEIVFVMMEKIGK